MKTERLYAITVYLLNHGRTSASELARHFEVSLRTIQRDMDSLCLAGIPVIAVNGAAGGYEITDRPFEKAHESADVILRKSDKTDSRQYTEILIRCKGAARARVTSAALPVFGIRNGVERVLAEFKTGGYKHGKSIRKMSNLRK